MTAWGRGAAAAVVLIIASSSAVRAGVTAALSRADLDTTCSPCMDFYRYATGGWAARQAIPAAHSSWGSFEALAERNREVLHGLVERAAKDSTAGRDTDTGKLGDYWCACMDSAAADAAGAKPIEALLNESEGLESIAGLAAHVAALHGRGTEALFVFRVRQDPKQSDRQIAFASQGGLGLPDRDYYTRNDSAAIATRTRYLTYLTNGLTLAGESNARAFDDAHRVLSLEIALAKASMTAVQRRDPVATYHKISADSLRRLAPRFGWDAYFGARGINALDSINVTQPEFFVAVDSLIAVVPLEGWKAYLRWRVISRAAPTLSRPFAEEAFQFSRTLSGAETMLPRWKRCLEWMDQDLGDMLGRLYVADRFPESARARARVMVKDLEAALAERLAVLEWMGPVTRVRAQEKLHAFEENIGYPKTYRGYESVKLSKTSLFSNRLSAGAYEEARNLAKIGQPVDRGEWFMTPPTVNAFYSSSLNTINFPAGILQPPFFDPTWDDAVNYGAIGAVIGHEMTHGFDDRGRQFDARGNLRDWWTDDDAAQYKARAQKVVEQFDSYTVLDTLHVNGRLTLGENLSDLGGVAVAFAALQKAQARGTRTKLDGFTPEQRFFLAWARVWADLTRPAAMRTRVLTNSHAPEVWRVNGPLSNLPEFAKAFGCKAGDPMVRPADKQARIW